jgi:MFS family permease
MALDEQAQKNAATGPFVAFRYRDYRLFWVGNAFSNIGIWALIAGRLWLMHELTDSALMLGLVTFSGLGPILVLSMWGGVVADRVNRMRLVVTTRAMFAVTALLTGVLVATDVIAPWQLLAISLANGVLLSFDIPSRQAIVPNLVPREYLMNAVVLQSFLMAGSTVIGPFFFAPLVNALGIEGVFFFVGSTYVLTVVMFALVNPRKHIGEHKTTMPWRDLTEGFGYIRRNNAIVSLVAIGILAGMFGSSFGTLMPIFADTVLGGGVQTYSNLLLAGGIGGFIGTVLLAFFGKLKDSAALQVLTGLGFGLGLALFAQITYLPASMGVILIVGAASTAFGTINNTLLQSIVADEFRGRVMSIHQLGWGSSAIGGLLMGSIAQAVSAPFAMSISGAIMAVGATALTLSVVKNGRARTREEAVVRR